jgi:hypothetical protein
MMVAESVGYFVRSGSLEEEKHLRHNESIQQKKLSTIWFITSDVHGKKFSSTI